MVETFILAMFGTSSSKYSISQKLLSYLTSISLLKTQDNFKINIQKIVSKKKKREVNVEIGVEWSWVEFERITQIRKSWAPSFSNQKKNVGSRQWLNKLMDLNHKILTLNQ